MKSALLLLVALSACGQGPTWHQDIAPIVERSCSGCHAFDAASATRQATRIAEMVASGQMPPWLPADADKQGQPLRYSNDPRPTTAQRALIAAWARDPEVGTPRRTGERFEKFEVFEGEPYAPGDRDEIRCFLLRPRPGPACRPRRRTGRPARAASTAAAVRRGGRTSPARSP